MTFTVAIVGRPNVGKSTLFNRLVGRRTALVHDRPGVTRDWREGEGKLGTLSFRVLDTPGVEEGDEVALRAAAHAERAAADADLLLFLLDARAGVTEADRAIAQKLRRLCPPVLLVANKCEGKGSDAGFYEAFALGFGEPVPISAEHNQGFADLLEALQPHMDERAPRAEAEGQERPIEIAIVGRPNVGKSTLANRLIGEERMLTGPEPGVTRDAIAVDWSYGGRTLRLVDTAGLRRRARVVDDVEALAAADTARAIGRAQVVILVLDAELGVERQDLYVAGMAVEEGRALVIAANKWDAVTDRDKRRREIRERIEDSLQQARGVPIVTLSAASGEGVDRLMEVVFQIYERWNAQISTARLNRWLEGALEGHSPPLVKGRRLKFRYMTQVTTRPPTFALFCNMVGEVPESYLRYLSNGLRETFDLDGVPLRLQVRRSKNPFASE